MPDYTIKDIARMAGVSTGTVSRVLNQAGNVAPDLYERTMEVVHRTNYLSGKRRSYWATRLHAVGARKICVVSPEMTPDWRGNSLWSDYLAGIEKACRERNFKLELQFAAPELSPRKMAETISQCSGILLKNTSEIFDFVRYIPEDMPVVGFGAYNPRVEYPQIVVDNRAAGMLATERLLELGHRGIVFVNHETHHRMFAPRAEGFVEVMRRAGCFREELLIELPSEGSQVRAPDKLLPDMTSVLDRIVNIQPRPTAVILANDFAAAGFYKACETAGFAIPASFSVCGMDNTRSICEVMSPTLSSMELPFFDVAEFAAATLIELIDGIGTHRLNRPSAQYLCGKLRERESFRALK